MEEQERTHSNDRKKTPPNDKEKTPAKATKASGETSSKHIQLQEEKEMEEQERTPSNDKEKTPPNDKEKTPATKATKASHYCCCKVALSQKWYLDHLVTIQLQEEKEMDEQERTHSNDKEMTPPTNDKDKTPAKATKASHYCYC